MKKLYIKQISKYLTLMISILYLFMLKTTHAGGGATGLYQKGVNLSSSGYMDEIYKWSVQLGGALAVIMIIWGGYEYVISSGEVEKINKAKEKIIGAIVGLLLLVLAALIINALAN